MEIPKYFKAQGRIINYAVIIIPLLIYFISAWPLRGWIIDDAGISFAYARNLAAGYGLVSQPGMPPVEGFSNFLWVIFLTPFSLLGIFDPYITTKIISFLLIGFTFHLIRKSITLIAGADYIPPLLVLSLLSFNAAFVTWTSSGLENPLYSLLTVSLFYFLIKQGPQVGFVRQSVMIGIITGAISLTRPEGLIFAALFPLVTIFGYAVDIRHNLKNRWRAIGVYALAFSVLFGAFILFRYLYFGEFVPNTYFVKGGPNLKTVLLALTLQGPYLTKMQDILSALTGKFTWVVMPALLIIWIIKKGTGGDYYRRIVFFTMTCLSLLLYLILPSDWMGEFRFATPFIPFFFMAIVLAAWDFLEPIRNKNGAIKYITGAIILLLAFPIQFPRLRHMHQTAPVNLKTIEIKFSRPFDKYADYLGIDNASLLLPDIGAPLYYSKIRIYDLSGLCDKIIAANIKSNPGRFYDYVFDEIKPTFIHTHGPFTAVSKFDNDPRFRAAYVPIIEFVDQHLLKNSNKTMMSGDYIRKEAIIGKEDLLENIRKGEIK